MPFDGTSMQTSRGRRRPTFTALFIDLQNGLNGMKTLIDKYQIAKKKSKSSSKESHVKILIKNKHNQKINTF